MKYIISSGKSVLSNIVVTEDESIQIQFTDNSDNAKAYDTFGDAMSVCDTVNNLLNKYAFKVMVLNEQDYEDYN